uniref:CRISPR-associated protein n=1 Tax=Siphoviridae sp. ctrCN24 TaxID=2827953 RepID=A0A8S5SK66_9CAUD|nr:MAG TPA: CRISPR-associated protein [Siphoviridae sp. ctrCN24]
MHVAYADCDGEVMLIDSKQAQSHKTNPRVGGA